MVSDEQKAFMSYHTRLQCFLYVLLRDHVTFGVLEEIMLTQVDKIIGAPPGFSEPSQAEYAKHLADRILRGELSTPEPIRPRATDASNPNTA